MFIANSCTAASFSLLSYIFVNGINAMNIMGFNQQKAMSTATPKNKQASKQTPCKGGVRWGEKGRKKIGEVSSWEQKIFSLLLYSILPPHQRSKQCLSLFLDTEFHILSYTISCYSSMVAHNIFRWLRANTQETDLNLNLSYKLYDLGDITYPF